MDEKPALSVKVAVGVEQAGVAMAAIAVDSQESEASAKRGKGPGQSDTAVTLPPTSPLATKVSSVTAPLSMVEMTKREGQKIGRFVNRSNSSELCLNTPPSSGTLERSVDARVSAPPLVPAPNPERTTSNALMLDTSAASVSTPADNAGSRTTKGSSALAAMSRWSSDEAGHSGGITHGTEGEEVHSSAPSNTPTVAPVASRGGGGAAIDGALENGPEEEPDIGEAARDRAEVQKEAREGHGTFFGADANINTEDTERIHRGDSLPPEINSMYAAVTSGIPGGVLEALSGIRDGQAVDELTARNGRILPHRSKSFRGSGIAPTGYGAGGNIRGGEGRGGGRGGGALGGKEEKLETLPMLAALSGNVDMFNAVLQAMRQKLRDARQITSVLEATDVEGRSLVASAAEGGSFAVVTKVVDVMGGEAAVFDRMSSKEAGYLVKMAAKSGCIEAFMGVADMMARNGKLNQAMKTASDSNPTWASVLVEAASSGSGEMVDTVVVAMLGALMDETVASTITASGGGTRHTTVLLTAVESRNLGAVTAVIKVISAIVDGSIIASSGSNNDEIADMIMAKNAWGMTALSCAATNGDLEIMLSLLDAMSKFLPRSQIYEACSFSFSKCCETLPTSKKDVHLKIFAYLLQHGAKPASKAFTRLCNHVSPSLLKESLLGAVSSSDNPFIPGMNLSVACTVASTGALEGDKRRLALMQAAVDELLLEILDRMPQTVMGFKNEMKDCSAIFEPEIVISSFQGCQGPLGVALTHRRQMETYCTTPLVLDYMSRKFTRGLPGLMDREGVLLNNKHFTETGQTLYGEGLIAEGKVFFFGMALQRDCGESTLSSITFLPGARFIIAGLLSRPGSYYKVPALRMALDLVTYLSMLATFSSVIVREGESVVERGEMVFAAFILGMILTECREMYADPLEYMRDQWNVLDVSFLVPLLIGLCFRVVGGANDHTGKACYALGAPLVFARILYFAQVLPSQGPMIQVFFSMTGLLVKFGTIMFVVMLGFVMSFYSLFQDTISYGEVWMGIFKAMLGETDYLDGFSGTRFDSVGTAILIVYILVLTIMMLNLLVAVLSTAHARVDNDVDLEYKVTKARLIQRYTRVVGIDRLPPPYNLIQWIVTLPFMVVEWCISRRARASSTPISWSTTASSFRSRSSSDSSPSERASSDCTSLGNHGSHGLVKAVECFFGRTVFWLALGPLSVVAGWALWAASVVKAPAVVWKASRDKPLHGKIARASLAIAVCAIGAPFWLFIMWVRGGFRGLREASTLVLARCCSPSTKKSRETQRRRGVHTLEERTVWADRNPPISSAVADTGVAEQVDDASGKVVTTALKSCEGALAVGELQLFLDDPMSDPDVRREEETQPTTVEHIKLLRNRLEATNKAHMDELRSCLERTTVCISRQLETAGLVESGGVIRGNAGGRKVDAGGGRVHYACDDNRHERKVGEVSPSLQEERPRWIVDAGSSQLDDRLEKLTSALEKRVVAMIDERLDALARKVDAIIAPLSVTPG